jgi:hypothetical protein
VEVCKQEQFKDFTGVDSLSAFLVSTIVFVGVQFIEHHRGGPLFSFPGDKGYDKEGAATGSALDKTNNTRVINVAADGSNLWSDEIKVDRVEHDV